MSDPADTPHAYTATCAGPMAEGCPRDEGLFVEDEQHAVDIGWDRDPITGLWRCQFCQGVIWAAARMR